MRTEKRRSKCERMRKKEKRRRENGKYKGSENKYEKSIRNKGQSTSSPVCAHKYNFPWRGLGEVQYVFCWNKMQTPADQLDSCAVSRLCAGGLLWAR
jgi:hypothetical protein